MTALGRLASTLAILALALGAARAQDSKDEDARLPFNPFARAEVGDWSTLFFTVYEKTLKKCVESFHLIATESAEHKADAFWYFDWANGFAIAPPDFPKASPGKTRSLAELLGPDDDREGDGTTSFAQLSVVAHAAKRAAWKPMPIAGLAVASRKDLTVSKRDAVLLEITGKLGEKEMHFLQLIVFDDAQTFTFTCAATKTNWEVYERTFRASVESFKLER